MCATYSEKLLGLHINSDLEWTTHVEKLSVGLKKRIGILARIKQRMPKNKLIIISESISNSKIRYGIAAYITPTFEREDLKHKKLSSNASELQVLQNDMLRLILGLKQKDHINMQQVREKIKMFSVNQMAIYHSLLETYNIKRKSASEQIKLKWEDKKVNTCSMSFRSSTNNDVKIPEKPSKKCTGFSYSGAKLFNILPGDIKKCLNSNKFKSMIKEWIWREIPSY